MLPNCPNRDAGGQRRRRMFQRTANNRKEQFLVQCCDRIKRMRSSLQMAKRQELSGGGRSHSEERGGNLPKFDDAMHVATRKPMFGFIRQTLCEFNRHASTELDPCTITLREEEDLVALLWNMLYKDLEPEEKRLVDSYLVREYEHHCNLQEEELGYLVQQYEEDQSQMLVLCPICRKGNLFLIRDEKLVGCSCDARIGPLPDDVDLTAIFERIQGHIARHAEACPYQPVFYIQDYHVVKRLCVGCDACSEGEETVLL